MNPLGVVIGDPILYPTCFPTPSAPSSTPCSTTQSSVDSPSSIQCSPPSCSVPVCTTRNIVFKFNPVQYGCCGSIYYYAVDQSTIDNVINGNGSGNMFLNKYPTSVYSLDPCYDLSQDIVPFNDGVGIALPTDFKICQVSFTAELRINSYNLGSPITTPNGFIDYLQQAPTPNSPPLSPQAPAVIQLQIAYVTNSGVLIDTNSGTTQIFTLQNMCSNSPGQSCSSNTPFNLIVKIDPEHPETINSYYSSCTSSQNPIVNITYPQSTLSCNGKPYGRPILTVVCTQGFSFNSAQVNITLQ